ncbi:MAG: hypothetical protein K1X94_17265 [Sandaracinaceae bacterium]|nr:hypothetical protein [Sandaracinaceae bacterium]
MTRTLAPRFPHAHGLPQVLCAALVIFAFASRVAAQDGGARVLARPTVQAIDDERPADVDTRETAPRLSRPDRGARVMAGVGMGLGMLVLGTGLGYGIGAGVPNSCSDGSWFCFHDHAIEGLFTGFSLGTALFPLSYSLGAYLAGGRGNAWGASLGFVIGAAVSVGTIALGVLANDELDGTEGDALLATSIVLGVLAPIVGTAIGYELTDAEAVQVLPTLSLDRDRVVLGVAGSF